MTEEKSDWNITTLIVNTSESAISSGIMITRPGTSYKIPLPVGVPISGIQIYNDTALIFEFRVIQMDEFIIKYDESIFSFNDITHIIKILCSRRFHSVTPCLEVPSNKVFIF